MKIVKKSFQLLHIKLQIKTKLLYFFAFSGQEQFLGLFLNQRIKFIFATF
jgi:hypothetical protein